MSGTVFPHAGGRWTYNWRWVHTTLFIWGITGPPPPLPGSRWQYTAPMAPLWPRQRWPMAWSMWPRSAALLTALELHTGTPRWSFAARKAISASPVVAGDVVYVASYDQTLTALDARQGRSTGNLRPVVPSMLPRSSVTGEYMWRRWTASSMPGRKLAEGRNKYYAHPDFPKPY